MDLSKKTLRSFIVVVSLFLVSITVSDILKHLTDREASYNLPASQNPDTFSSSGNPPEDLEKWFIPEEIRDLARVVTVRIYSVNTEAWKTVDLGVIDGSGSGVIVASELPGNNFNLYLVLTSKHVLPSSSGAYIQTHDGLVHHARVISEIDFGNDDLGLLWFASPYHYIHPPQIGQEASNIKDKETTFISGFPCELSTAESSCPANFVFLEGEIYPVDRPLSDGYQLGLSHKTQEGTSGGPIFNHQGQLIGINGRGKTSLTSPQYNYADGSGIPEKLRSTGPLALGIPIANYIEALPENPFDVISGMPIPIAPVKVPDEESKDLAFPAYRETQRRFSWISLSSILGVLLIFLGYLIKQYSKYQKSKQNQAEITKLHSEELAFLEELNRSVLIKGPKGIGTGIIIAGEHFTPFKNLFGQDIEVFKGKTYILTSINFVDQESNGQENLYIVITPDQKHHRINYDKDIYKDKYSSFAIIKFS